MVLFKDWFNPFDAAHCKALQNLKIYGVWDSGFIPPEVELEPGWYANLMFRLGDLWIKERIMAQDLKK